MQAVVCTKYGPPEVLRLEEVPTPVPRKNEVRIRILATAVTSSDCYTRGLRLSPAYRIMGRLALGWNAPRQPVLGMVLSGEVDSVGPAARACEVCQVDLGISDDGAIKANDGNPRPRMECELVGEAFPSLDVAYGQVRTLRSMDCHARADREVCAHAATLSGVPLRFAIEACS